LIASGNPGYRKSTGLRNENRKIYVVMSIDI
jgi:hypothetical protein